MRILFLSAWYPYPPNNGSKLRIHNLLRGLAQHHEVELISLVDPRSDRPSSELARSCSGVSVVPRRAYQPTSARALVGLLSPTPRSLVDTYVPAMAERIERAVDRRHDLVIASQGATAAYARSWRGLPAIFEEVELAAFQSAGAASMPLRSLRQALTLQKLRAYLRRLLPRFAACTVVSEPERALARRLVPSYRGPVELIPNCVDLTSYQDVLASPQPGTLIFAGSLSYSANHDAMTWFLRHVYPLIKTQVPTVRLTITGDHANRPLPPAADVELTGLVDDVRPAVASSWVSLAPIRLGGGTRLKILEAMALRSPVVSTTKGAEGLEVRDGEHLLLADTPAAFADAVLRLLQERQLRRRLTDRAYHLVAEQYHWPAVMPRFLQLAEYAAAGDRRASAGPEPASVA